MNCQSRLPSSLPLVLLRPSSAELTPPTRFSPRSYREKIKPWKSHGWQPAAVTETRTWTDEKGEVVSTLNGPLSFFARADSSTFRIWQHHEEIAKEKKKAPVIFH